MFYVMDCLGLHPSTAIAQAPFFRTGPWLSGRRINLTISGPLEYALDPKRPGLLKPYYKRAQPLMRLDLIEALSGAGVDNLQLYDAVLIDPTTDEHHTNYRAVNVVGLVAAADMKKSVLSSDNENTLGDAAFDALAIEEVASGDLLLFRLAENVGALVVHEQVKVAVENRAIPGMVFYGEGEWSSI